MLIWLLVVRNRQLGRAGARTGITASRWSAPVGVAPRRTLWLPDILGAQQVVGGQDWRGVGKQVLHGAHRLATVREMRLSEAVSSTSPLPPSPRSRMQALAIYRGLGDMLGQVHTSPTSGWSGGRRKIPGGGRGSGAGPGH